MVIMIECSQNIIPFVGKSNQIKSVLEDAHLFCNTPNNVLIEGETGTGKELVARIIHNLSKRNNKPFVVIDCAAIPNSLFESEFMGHEQGSYTGANHRYEGRLATANGGTVVLDNFEEMIHKPNKSLLRFLQFHTIQRIGNKHETHLDVKVLVLSNANLKKLMEKGLLPKDLYYRLYPFRTKIPPLRERKRDIPLISDYYLEKYSSLEKKSLRNFSRTCLEILKNFEWPGNVRQLENVIHASIIRSSDEMIFYKDLPEQFIEDLKIQNLDSSHKMKEILDFLILKKTISNRNVQELFACSSDTARKLLHKLLDQNILIRNSNVGRNVQYCQKTT
ncbi:hypothetical protein BVY01_00695 [bacterium I07]|nr:hypothetical protein BVY01_00695 [bacterium I07]